MEAAVGEGVEGDRLQAARGQFGAQAAYGVGIGGQFGDHVAGQPQADAEQVGAEALPYGLGVRGELVHHSVEVLGLVDVAAIGEVDGGAVGVSKAHGGVTLRRV